MPHFERASGISVYNSSFVDVTYRGVAPNIGRRLLAEASLFNAVHDSAAHENLDPPLPATRHRDLIEELDDLISGGEPSFRALVFTGPKSNLAHLCAKRLEDGLCASFFVSQSLQTNDHVRFFPTIAWQLSIQFPAYSTLLEKELRRDPSILYKTLEVQFKKLIVDPFRELLAEGHDFGQRKVIVIDGLEEYAKVQTSLNVLRIILSRAGEFPFIWLVFSQRDKVLNNQVVEMGSTVGMPWGEGYPALKARTYAGGNNIHGFLLVHGRSRSSYMHDFESKNIMTAA